MVDYYSTLLRAVTASGAGDAQWRRDVYDRARQMLSQRLRGLRPPPPMSEIAAEEAALEAAIERVEAQMAWSEHRAAVAEDEAADDSAAWVEPDRGPLAQSPRLRSAALIAIAVVAAALGAGGYVAWSGRSHQTVQTPAAKSEAPRAAPSASRPVAVATAKNGELAPGVDGGSSDPDQPYVFRRQPTFYRTLQPVGTVIVDKLQHFLYLIQPNSVALRYGVAIGEHCLDLAGLRHIATMSEWPSWQPPPDLINRNPSAMPGGPGNPLGARLLALDDGTTRIHGTNAPKTIGNVVSFGCIRLANDDIADLYSRVRINTPVIVN